MASVSRSDLRRVAARTWLLQATWNYERQQGLGWAWALSPALERFYPDRGVRCDRLAEHTAFFNTQPTLASLALGAAAALEEQRSLTGAPDADGMRRVKNVLASSLAALGDRMFWLTLRPLAACLGVILAASGSALGAAALWVCYNAMHQGLRFAGVAWGYRLGPAVLSGELRPRLERMIGAWALIGVAVVGAIVAVLLAPGGSPRPAQYQVVLAAGLLLGLLAAQRVRPSPTEWAFGAGILSLIVTWPR